MHTWGYFYEKAFNYSLTLFNVYGITQIFTFFLCQFWYLRFSRNIPFYVNFQVYGQKLIAFYPFNVCAVKSYSSYWCFLTSPFLSCTSPPLVFIVPSILSCVCFTEAIVSARFLHSSWYILLDFSSALWQIFVVCVLYLLLLLLFFSSFILIVSFKKDVLLASFDHSSWNELRLISYTNALRSKVDPEPCFSIVGIFPMFLHFHKRIHL